MYSMDIHPVFVLGAAGLGVVLSAVALLRAYVPPQTRDVAELAARVSDLEAVAIDYGKRLTARARKENMDTARQAHEVRKAQRDAVLEEAAALIAQQPRQQQQLPLAQMSKDQLRAALLLKERQQDAPPH